MSERDISEDGAEDLNKCAMNCPCCKSFDFSLHGAALNRLLDQHRIGDADCDCLDLSHCKLPRMNGLRCRREGASNA